MRTHEKCDEEQEPKAVEFWAIWLNALRGEGVGSTASWEHEEHWICGTHTTLSAPHFSAVWSESIQAALCDGHPLVLSSAQDPLIPHAQVDGLGWSVGQEFSLEV